ncbi:GLPGLI family protein [Epilithonimonas lactis]|uniref:GLPGLI family protein n=1 Tax=Epilithonimonas lactis TaxID=421072 RepID=UPI00068AF2DE|nr:GLPGLI family protein [Epilithonimonas lactis]SEQ20522.1 GLPGLI family protein [Epilithonimonas lactis]
MKKLLTIASLLILTSVNAQVHRFYYELTYKPNKDSVKTEKEMMVLDVAKDESVFLPYKQLQYDSLLAASIKKQKELGSSFDMSKFANPPHLGFRIIKLKSGNLNYKDIVGVSENYNYDEDPDLKWEISSDKEKIGTYNVQKATIDYGGRSWTAWFTSEIPIQDGPYKFSGLPGLIIKLEDSGKNFIWNLEGNKKLKQNINSNKLNYLEEQGMISKKITKKAFLKRQQEYSNNPMGQMMQMFDEKDAVLMKKLKEEETRVKSQIIRYNNPIEIH